MTQSSFRPLGRIRCAAAFTLVELLVVIGIIGVLLAIVLPAIFSTSKQADRSRTRADLASVEMALEEYRKDFKDYPRHTLDQVGRQDRLLGWALLGPFAALPDTSVSPKVPGDGADGMGFRTSYTIKKDLLTNTMVVNQSGRIWGPYLPVEKFKAQTEGRGSKTVCNGGLLDRYDSPILYFVRWSNYKPGMGLFGVPPGGNPPQAPPAIDKVRTVYDWGAGFADDTNSYGVLYLRKAMGDDDLSDVINGSEQFKEAPPFLLLSKGSRKKYTGEDTANGKNKIMTQFDRCDEVANIPSQK